jgi:hypothetical protein
MALRVFSPMPQRGSRKCGTLGAWFSERPKKELGLQRQASNKKITMPIVITFDIQGAPPVERNRIQSFFERFGWENLGGSSYRYPRLGTDDQPVEDWFNHVIPALMLFRTYLVSSGRTLTKCTLDVQSSSGYSPNANYGKPPLDGAAAPLYLPTNTAFGEQNLRSWLTDMPYPY